MEASKRQGQRDYAERERALLSDLTDLITSTTSDEAEIEREYTSSKATIERHHDESMQRHEETHRGAARRAESEHEERVRAIEKRYQDDRDETVRTAESIRLEITEKGEHSEKKANKQHQDAVWLAESVFEGHEHRPEEEYDAYRTALQGTREEIKGIEANAVRYIKRVRHRPIPAGDEAVEVETPAPETAQKILDRARRKAGEQLDALQRLRGPRMYRGLWPVIPIVAMITIPGVVAAALTGWTPLQDEVWYSAGGGLVFTVVVGVVLYFLSARRIAAIQREIRVHRATADSAIEVCLSDAQQRRDARETELKTTLDRDLAKANSKHDEVLEEIGQRRERYFREIEERRETQLEKIEGIRAEALEREAQRDQAERARLDEEDARIRAELDRVHENAKEDRESNYTERWSTITSRWNHEMSRAAAQIGELTEASATLFPKWDDPHWTDWRPHGQFTPVIRFGELGVDLSRLPGGLPKDERLAVHGDSVIALPTMIELPNRCSLLMETGPDGHEEAVRTLQTVMFRLLTTLPPGKVRFTIVDPVGLGQNFAAFMHLSDYDGQLVADRIWTETRHIEQRLADLTEHMENVIQKYLRNEFETIDEYNAKAGEIAEPYRFLVVADLPVNFSETAARRLASIVTSGARCGIYTLIVTDPTAKMPPGVTIDDLERNATTLLHDNGRFVYDDEDFRNLPLTLDMPPDEGFVTKTIHAVGAAAKASARVEVPFDVVAPQDGQMWSASCSEVLTVPLGRSGATKLQELSLGRGTSQHALIAGKTGSGKSTLLHVIITNLALWYSPDEVELYLVDFKKGVEFKAYASDQLPHVRVVGVETDREFGLSVLQRIDIEMKRRGELFRDLEVQDIGGYRRASGQPLPRTLLIVDEFQELFVEDDKVAQDAALLLDRLVRQGRAFGVHVILGSQTLGGAYSLARSTIGQMAVRIALQCNESDSYLILSEDNSGARLLSRPGEAIYNDAGGLIEGNSPFQIVWMSDEMRNRNLDRVLEASKTLDGARPKQIVFEGNVPGDIERNHPLTQLCRADAYPEISTVSRAWFGEAIAIKDPTCAEFRRQSGSNLLVVGQREETALSVMVASMMSLAAHAPPDGSTILLLDGTPADSPFAGVLPSLAEQLPHGIRNVAWRDVPEAMAFVHAHLQKRADAHETDGPPIFILVNGLQRYRMLRRAEDFGFSSGFDDPDAPPKPEKQFAEILGEGPGVGIHTIAWVDTFAHASRALDRQGIGDFVMRVLFQMGGADSTSLIDTPAAANLGMRRALFYHEEHGTLEKFRPYALPEKAWIEQVVGQLSRRT